MFMNKLNKMKGNYLKALRGWVWWRTLVIPVLWEVETGGSGFVVSLSYLVRSSAT